MTVRMPWWWVTRILYSERRKYGRILGTMCLEEPLPMWFWIQLTKLLALRLQKFTHFCFFLSLSQNFFFFLSLSFSSDLFLSSLVCVSLHHSHHVHEWKIYKKILETNSGWGMKTCVRTHTKHVILLYIMWILLVWFYYALKSKKSSWEKNLRMECTST